MAKHMEDMNAFKAKCEARGVHMLEDNIEDFIDKTDDHSIWESQQDIIEIIQHASDISPPTRAFNTAKQWTYLLFDEFFQQGDQEKFEKLQVSFLCDRDTTNVASS